MAAAAAAAVSVRGAVSLNGEFGVEARMECVEPLVWNLWVHAIGGAVREHKFIRKLLSYKLVIGKETKMSGKNRVR